MRLFLNLNQSEQLDLMTMLKSRLTVQYGNKFAQAHCV